MSFPTVDKTKTSIEVTRRVSLVLADAKGGTSVVLADTSGNVPTEFELLKVGMWRTPYHGDIMITPDDLNIYVDNFKAGLAVPGNGKIQKLPINYAHESWEKAAGWFVPEVRGDTLWATEVEWTPAGRQSLIDGEWKCISAEFCPAGRGGWLNPLNEDEYVENVLEGAALTNIPLFSNLDPVKASATFGKDSSEAQVFFVTASEEKKENAMDLATITAKTNDQLSDEEKNFLADHKDELNDDQKRAFGFEVTAADNTNTNNEEEEAPVNTTTPTVEPELASVAASIKAGTHVLVKADTLNRLEETDKQYRQEKADAIVKAHVSRGAIKADAAPKWAEKLVNANSAERAEIEELLDGLNGNETVAADTQGSGADVTAKNAADEIREKANELIKASREAGTEISLGDAMSKVMRENKELADRYNAEQA